jgi:BlaI family penicillinase repressor
MKLNNSEWSVMNALWSRSPASGREVLEQVGEDTGWAYSTVKTILARLVEKGALRMGKRANTSIYHPLVTRESARQSALASLLNKAFDGTFGSLVQHVVSRERLSKRERETLSSLLIELQTPRGGEG